MRLIDADALLDDCIFSSKELEMFIKEFINDAPIVDAVPVVRCRDCRWAEDTGPTGLYCNHPDGRNTIHALPEEFCDRGERSQP